MEKYPLYPADADLKVSDGHRNLLDDGFPEGNGSTRILAFEVVDSPPAEPVQTIFDLSARGKVNKIVIVWTCVPGNKLTTHRVIFFRPGK